MSTAPPPAVERNARCESGRGRDTSPAARLAWVLITLAFTVPVHAWDISMNFEDGDGAAREVAAGKCSPSYNRYRFTDAAGLTVFTDEDGFGSRQAARLTIKKGTGGFGKWGGIISLPSCVNDVLRPGDELWLRIRMKFPQDWKFTKGERLKFVRLRTYDPEGNESSYVDFQLSHPGYPGRGGLAPFHFISEFDTKQGWSLIGEPEQHVDFGVWETYELYFKINHITADKDPVNGARVIAWKNGKLAGEATGTKTIQGKNHTIRAIYLFTYWNSGRGEKGAPQTQSLLIDDIWITNRRVGKKRDDFVIGNRLSKTRKR